MKSDFVEKVKAGIKDKTYGSGNKNLTKVAQMGSGCRVVDDKAELSAAVDAMGMSKADIDTASTELATMASQLTITDISGGGRLLSGAAGRRLVTVSNAYSSQGAEVCATDDNTCGAQDPALTTGTTASSTTSGGTTGAATTGGATTGSAP